MSAQHHGGPQTELQKRFMEQLAGTAKREYPAGRMGAEDDGTLSYAMTTDQKKGVIVLRFGKPVEWIGLGIEEAEELRRQLGERIMALRGVTA